MACLTGLRNWTTMARSLAWAASCASPHHIGGRSAHTVTGMVVIFWPGSYALSISGCLKRTQWNMVMPQSARSPEALHARTIYDPRKNRQALNLTLHMSITHSACVADSMLSLLLFIQVHHLHALKLGVLGLQSVPELASSLLPGSRRAQR